MKSNILITGCSGFIGYHLVIKLCKNKATQVVGIDNLNTYYDIKLKKDRLKELKKIDNFIFHKTDISNFKQLNKIFKKYKFNYLINLAAQAGVRLSIQDPDKYFSSNILGFYNILKLAVNYKIKNLFYASSSSVYGDQKKFPLKENNNTDNPVSFYAASKKTNEILSHSFKEVYGINTIGFRFFTVYGPYGRPDMAYYKFLNNLYLDKEISIFNNGNLYRDFTYIDDIVNVIEKFTKLNQSKLDEIGSEIFNIGATKPIKLIDFIEKIENITNKKFKKNYVKMQLGDVYKTHADVSKYNKYIKYKNKFSLDKGLNLFIKWFKDYNSI